MELWFGFPVWRSWRMRGGIYREATTAGVEVERSKGRRRPTTWREGGSEGTRRTAGESGVGVLERWMVRSRCLAAVPACQHAQRRRRAQVFFSMLVCPPVRRQVAVAYVFPVANWIEPLGGKQNELTVAVKR